MQETTHEFKPYIAAEAAVKELTPRAVILGCIFGILFGAASVYLALKAGLTVSASIPVAVLAISIGRKFLKTTILENNIIQTTASAGESIASGVVFTLTGFLFLSLTEKGDSVGAPFFDYWTIFILAALGGVLGTLMMIPLRRSLIVKEHGNLPYPEGTACGSVLIAGEKGGSSAKTAYFGLGFAMLYVLLQKVLHIIAEAPTYVTKQTNKYLPSATVNGEITPEYMGVGYIVGFRIAGTLVAGGVLAWLGLIPLLAGLVPMDSIAQQLVKLGYLQSLTSVGGTGNWDPTTHTFANTAEAVYRAYVRQIGAGAVAAGGFITLLKTIPTIISSFKDSLGSFKTEGSADAVLRTEKDLSVKTVLIGSVVLVILMMALPQIPGDSILQKLLIGVLVVIFGFFFVTVSSRIVGLIGSSSNPISGMTIATLMATSLVFIGFGMTGHLYEPMVLVVGGIVCIAAANGGATSQDLKTGYIVGATPRNQQICLFIGAVVASIVIGLTVKMLDVPSPDMAAKGIIHAIGSDKFPAPQGTLMATLIKGMLSFNLDWNFVLVGVFLAITMELCGVNALNFAVGAYLPLSTTLPIFAGGCIKKFVEFTAKRRGEKTEDDELGSGSLFATGLVAGGALAGVIIALLSIPEPIYAFLQKISLEHTLTHVLGAGGYQLAGVLFFVLMGFTLYRIATSKPAS
ncbi:MAG: oligopeptide transporter, OPT family [Candidatus Melainabacteria bacterium]|jgi:OPT family oligopeptide transporter|nr:oligopeptide transporter, OPT family [Candidatus Melainabacteria bacterium]